jgi:endonuclease/exonuclease/phosphatase (EEP) superfamily protein YafD
MPELTIEGADAPEVEPAPRRRVRSGGRPVTIGAWAVVAGFAVWAVVRVFGLEQGFPFIQLIAFTPYVAGAAVLVPLLALALRRWPAAVAAGVVATALVACLVPRATADGGPLPTGPTLRVLTANMRVGGADPAAIVGLVRSQHVDLLAIQEFTPAAQVALEAAGLAEALPNRSAHPLEGVGGSALYSRFPLRDDGMRMNPHGFGQAKATVTVPGAAPVAVESAHPCAPSDPDRSSCWSEGLRDEPPATVDGQVRVLLGDFNATLDHALLRQIIATGYRDAADVTGAGLGTTWPYDKLFPRVALDHVLADRRVGVRQVSIHPVPDTDHRAVFAELVLPPG